MDSYCAGCQSTNIQPVEGFEARFLCLDCGRVSQWISRSGRMRLVVGGRDEASNNTLSPEDRLLGDRVIRYLQTSGQCAVPELAKEILGESDAVNRMKISRVCQALMDEGLVQRMRSTGSTVFFCPEARSRVPVVAAATSSFASPRSESYGLSGCSWILIAVGALILVAFPPAGVAYVIFCLGYTALFRNSLRKR